MYRVRLLKFGDMKSAFDRAPDVVRREITTALSKGTILVETAVKELTPVGVSGLLRNTVNSEVKELGNAHFVGAVGSGISKDEEYPWVIEAGRKPGKKRPPTEALVRWVEKKLSVPSENAQAVAADIAWAISKHGIKGRRMFQRAWDAKKERVHDYFDTAVLNIIKSFEKW